MGLKMIHVELRRRKQIYKYNPTTICTVDFGLLHPDDGGQQISMGISFLMVRFVSNGASRLPDEGNVLEASNTHWLEFLDERVRIRDLIPERLTLFHAHTGQVCTASITRESHGDGIPESVGREPDIRKLLR